MRELHVVALSEDGRSVVLATAAGAKKGGYTVRLDGPLTAAVRGELRRPGEPDEPEVVLTPKDIQSRLRAGETPQQIADAAGVPVSRVERFEGPVISERQRVVEQTRDAHLVRGRKGRSALPLGVVVDRQLEATPGLDEDSVDWFAKRRDEGSWEVSLTWTARGRARTAHWLYDPASRSATALDPASAALAHTDSERAPAPATRSAKKSAAKKAAPKPAAKKAAPKPAAKKAAPKPAAKKAAPKPAVKKAAPKPAVKKAAPKPVVKKAAPKKAAPVSKAAPKPVVTKAAVTKVAPKPAVKKAPPAPVAPKRVAKRAAAPPVPEPPAPPKRVLRIVPDSDVVPVPQRRVAGGRASVPGWADVLLGATPSTPSTPSTPGTKGSERDGDEG